MARIRVQGKTRRREPSALHRVAVSLEARLANVVRCHGSHLNLNDTLKEGGRDSVGASKGNRARSLLVIGEVAVSFVLLIGAGLLINSFFHLRNLDPGFRADHLLTMKVDLSDVKYPDRERRAAFFDEVMRRVHAAQRGWKR